MLQWVKMLAGSMCIIQLLMNLIPNKRYEPYVRLYAGMLLFLVGMGPLLRLFSEDIDLRNILDLQFLHEEMILEQKSLNALEELKNEKIMNTIRSDIQNQIKKTVELYGCHVQNMHIQYDTEYSCYPMRIWMCLEDTDKKTDAEKRIVKELAFAFHISESNISVERFVPEGEH